MVIYLLFLKNSISEYRTMQKYSRYYCLEQCFSLALLGRQLDKTKSLVLCLL